MEEIVKKKIVITGMGAVTPIGSGVEEYWNNLIAGACGIDKIRQFDATDLAVRIAAEVHSFDLQKYMPKKMIHETDAFTQYATWQLPKPWRWLEKRMENGQGRMPGCLTIRIVLPASAFLQIRIKWVSLWGLPWLELLRRQRRRKS